MRETGWGTVEIPAEMFEERAPLIERLRDEADLCRAETAIDVADILDEAADEIERLRKLLKPEER